MVQRRLEPFGVTPSAWRRVSPRWLAALVRLSWLLLLCVWSISSWASSGPQRTLSSYEQESIQVALARIGGGARETDPEGKTVEDVVIVTLEVFEERDQVPTFINWLHTVTRDYIIEREVLLQPGQPYRQALAEESERNLRGFIQLSVVLVVPLRGSTPDSVKLLVVTKDVWSLRLSWEPRFFNGKLTYLTLAPSEWNIAGTAQTISARLTLTARNYWLGGTYSIPRVGGSRIQGYINGNAIMNCRDHRLEGATGYMQYGQPLYSLRTRWSWNTAASWNSLIRQPVELLGQAVCADQGAPVQRITDIDVAERTRAELVSGSGSLTRDTELRRDVLVPQRYREENLRGQIVVTRSFNTINKLNLSFGVEAEQIRLNDLSDDHELTGVDTLWVTDPVTGQPDRAVRNVERYDIDDPRFTDEMLEEARRGYRTGLALNSPGDGSRLPRSRLILGNRRVSPYVQLRSFKADFRRIINYNTLGLQEDVQAGHDVYLRLYPAFRPLSSRDLLGVFSSAGHTWFWRDGFLRAVTSGKLELAADGNEELSTPISGMEQSDASVQAAAHAVSPRFVLGRFISSSSFTHNPIRYMNRFLVGVGGADRLRGYDPTAFLGTTSFVMNNEFRSRPLQILSALVGFSLFHDMGDAARDPRDFELKHGGGFGVRVLFPQLDRDVLRFDFGFPLQQHERGQFTFSAGFGQVFTEPFAAHPALLAQ